MRTRARGLSAAVLLCATLSASAQPQDRPTRPITLTEAIAIAQAEADRTTADEVRVELRVMSVGGKEGREAVAKLFEGVATKKGDPKTAFLTDKQLFAVLEKCAADRSTNILQAPRIVAEAGKPVVVRMMDTTMYTTAVAVKVVNGKPLMVPTTEAVETGTKINVSATPSADGKYVELKMSYHDKQAKPHPLLVPVTTVITPEFADGNKGEPVPFTQFVQVPEFDELKAGCTAKLPDGGTVAVHVGKQMRTTRTDFGPPVISQIPYLNRLFKNTCEVECDVVVFATTSRVKEVTKAEPPKVVAVATWSPAGNDEVAKLVAAYHKACTAGDKDEAARLAVQALAKDPTCFGK